MTIVLKNYNNLILNINQKFDCNKVNIIAVSKTFSLDHIKPLIEAGHIHFGENKVQEAIDKWTETKKKDNKIKLHMVGKLQRNKVKKSLQLFDYIHSLDNIKLADTIAKEEEKLNRKLKYFIIMYIKNHNNTQHKITLSVKSIVSGSSPTFSIYNLAL